MVAEEALGAVAETSQEAQSFNPGHGGGGGMHGTQDSEIGNNYHSAGKRLKMSHSNIPGIPQSKTCQWREDEENGNSLFHPGRISHPITNSCKPYFQ